MRRGGKLWWAGAGMLFAVLAGCGAPGHSSTTTVPVSTIPSASTTTSTTIPGVQTAGIRTVLSPIGLNVRATPAPSGKVLGTAGPGVTLTVVGYDAANGGWYHVRGATVTGWMSARPALSAEGSFTAYSSALLNFSAYYPTTWTVSESAKSDEFVAPSGGDKIEVVAGANLAALPKGHPGYALVHSEQIVVCGVTTYLDGYAGTTPPSPYIAQISVPLDKTHALGIEASLAGPSQLSEVRTFAYSLTFPYPACEG